MINKNKLPAERVNITVTNRGAESIGKIFRTIDGIDRALELTIHEGITLDTTTGIIVLHLTNRERDVLQWRARWHGGGRDSIVRALTEVSGRRGERSLTEDIIRLREHRDNKLPAAWQYKTQPLVKRLISESGYQPAEFLKACSLHAGKIHNLPEKPKGEVVRTIKLKTIIPLRGEIKDDQLIAEYLPLGGGAYLSWKTGISPTYNIHLPQELPEIIQDSLIGMPASDLVDDPRVKNILGELTVLGFTPWSRGHQINLDSEESEMMEDEPEWIADKHQRLNNRLADWATS